MALGNTVRSYLQVATGAYLYMADYFFRHGGKPQDPKGPSLGFLGSAPEGSLYGEGKPRPRALLINVAAVWCGPCNEEALMFTPTGSTSSCCCQRDSCSNT